ncbi:MAG: MFS transporter [Spirochaetales bacterium]|nr:MFS transporter [Spirochaetales bacterium]
MIDYSRRNFNSFIWHAVFLALTLNFVDINTVIPNLILKSGGGPIYLGMLSAIMIGGTGVMQLFFAGFLINKPKKKFYLITGISLRISALLLLGFILFTTGKNSQTPQGGFLSGPVVILMIMAVFSFSGSFANISYVDILGKAFPAEKRKRFFIIKQTISSFGVILSAIIVRVTLGLLPYPFSYALLFTAAGLLLLTASLGFWRLKEPESKVMKTPSLAKKFTLFKKAVLEDKNLRYYLLLINTSGVILGMIPFLIGLARKSFNFETEMIGNYLIIQMAGALCANLLFNLLNKNQKYKGILYYFIISAAVIPPAALLLSGYPAIFPLLFILSGSSLAAYQVAIPGILLEISTEENRPVYTGISGAGSLAVLLFPVIAGLSIEQFGYVPIFLISSVIILSGMFFAQRIICTRINKN